MLPTIDAERTTARAPRSLGGSEWRLKSTRNGRSATGSKPSTCGTGSATSTGRPSSPRRGADRRGRRRRHARHRAATRRPCAARGSGHSTTVCGVADGGTVVDMTAMNRILEIGDRHGHHRGRRAADRRRQGARAARPPVLREHRARQRDDGQPRLLRDQGRVDARRVRTGQLVLRRDEDGDAVAARSSRSTRATPSCCRPPARATASSESSTRSRSRCNRSRRWRSSTRSSRSTTSRRGCRALQARASRS